jgi:hypothetical protein
MEIYFFLKNSYWVSVLNHWRDLRIKNKEVSMICLQIFWAYWNAYHKDIRVYCPARKVEMSREKKIRGQSGRLGQVFILTSNSTVTICSKHCLLFGAPACMPQAFMCLRLKLMEAVWIKYPTFLWCAESFMTQVIQ